MTQLRELPSSPTTYGIRESFDYPETININRTIKEPGKDIEPEPPLSVDLPNRLVYTKDKLKEFGDTKPWKIVTFYAGNIGEEFMPKEVGTAVEQDAKSVYIEFNQLNSPDFLNGNYFISRGKGTPFRCNAPIIFTDLSEKKLEADKAKKALAAVLVAPVKKVIEYAHSGFIADETDHDGITLFYRTTNGKIIGPEQPVKISSAELKLLNLLSRERKHRFRDLFSNAMLRRYDRNETEEEFRTRLKLLGKKLNIFRFEISVEEREDRQGDLISLRPIKRVAATNPNENTTDGSLYGKSNRD